MSKYQVLKEAIENICEWNLRNLWNTFCGYNNWDEDHVSLNNEDFFNLYYENKPVQLVIDISRSDYNWHHKYVMKKDSRGGLKSFDNLLENIDVDALIKWLLNDNLWIVRDIIDEDILDEVYEEE